MEPTDTPSISEIEKLEDRRHAAMVAGDVDALDDLLSDALVYTHSNAGVDTKSSYLRSLRDGALVYRVLEHTSENVVRRPGVAVVIGSVAGSIQAAGAVRTLNSRFSAVWAAENGAWRLLAYQSTPLAG